VVLILLYFVVIATVNAKSTKDPMKKDKTLSLMHTRTYIGLKRREPMFISLMSHTCL